MASSFGCAGSAPLRGPTTARPKRRRRGRAGSVDQRGVHGRAALRGHRGQRWRSRPRRRERPASPHLRWPRRRRRRRRRERRRRRGWSGVKPRSDGDPAAARAPAECVRDDLARALHRFARRRALAAAVAAFGTGRRGVRGAAFQRNGGGATSLTSCSEGCRDDDRTTSSTSPTSITTAARDRREPRATCCARLADRRCRSGRRRPCRWRRTARRFRPAAATRGGTRRPPAQ